MLSQETKNSLANVFQVVHTSVSKTSQKMLAVQKRMNYVTPTNYLELVKGCAPSPS